MIQAVSDIVLVLIILASLFPIDSRNSGTLGSQSWMGPYRSPQPPSLICLDGETGPKGNGSGAHC